VSYRSPEGMMSDSLEPEAVEVPPNVVVLKLDTPYLGSRQIAVHARARLAEIIDGDKTAVADAEGVAVMTPSFADECFGGLLDQLGEERFRSSVKIDNLNESCRLLVEAVLQRRKPTAPEVVTPDDDETAPEVAAAPDEPSAVAAIEEPELEAQAEPEAEAEGGPSSEVDAEPDKS